MNQSSAQSPKADRKWLALITLAIAAIILAFIALGGIENNLVYFLDVQQLTDQGGSAKGSRIQLGGVVQQGSVDYDPNTLALHFQVGMVAQGEPSISVSAQGAPPQMFREGIGVVVEGIYDGQGFIADRVLVKHNNEYQAPKEGERPEQIYKTLIGAEATR